MPSYPSPIPPPVFDSDESDETSQSNDSSSCLSSQFNQYTRLSLSPKSVFNTTGQVLPLTSSLCFDEFINTQDDFTPTESLNMKSKSSEISMSMNKKRKGSNDKSEQISFQTPNQSPFTRRKNLGYVQQTTLQSPKVQRQNRHYNQSLNMSTSNFVNINPFNSENVLSHQHHYHTRLVTKRQSALSPSLRNLFSQRFEREFHHESFLGYGEFSHVYLCINRLDGLNYAIKTSKKSIIGTSYERIAWREICAYAILISHENLVRYYSGWIEPDGRFFIQLEYCNGGSLEDIVEKNREQKIFFNEDELKNILHQMSDVLTFMHSKDLAHLDIKPSNIMLCQYINKYRVYKLTDLGHVNQISLSSIDEDGDNHYLALEIIQRSITKQLKLDKCDIFSLGLTLYVCATNYILPKQGNEWQQLRLHISQYLYPIAHCTKEFNTLLLERMCNIDSNQRPSAHDVSSRFFEVIDFYRKGNSHNSKLNCTNLCRKLYEIDYS